MDIGNTPIRRIRARSARSSPPVIALRCSHSPQAADTPDKPRARRNAANPSKNAFPAA
ncbi:hypothetical protein OIM90_01600 [Streptomyces sp. AD16]|nr:hypothetical protein OIM90_01600 [Streptomyces sp. AD16]